MKVLWFEITTPSNYDGKGLVIGGWQDALEDVVKNVSGIELYIAFPSKEKVIKIVDGVTFIPVDNYPKNIFEKVRNRYFGEDDERRTVAGALRVINEVKPDIVHIFGMEWSWVAVAKHTKIPCVVHIMGSLVPYYNAMYPPKYSIYSIYKLLFPNIKEIAHWYLIDKKHLKKSILEEENWKDIQYFMGRTEWDYALTHILNPKSNYYHVDEALRTVFFESKCKWNPLNDGIIHLVSTGCTTFWKGPDMLLKVAHILKRLNISFDWKVAGFIPNTLKTIVEKNEKIKYSDNNVTFLGFVNPEDLSQILSKSSIYVHTAYVENSPNSICEAQLLGLPIISTNVGGITSLMQNTGILVPANDPWQMAYAIISLAKDFHQMKKNSEDGRKLAMTRHNHKNIEKQLLHCYYDIISK